MGLAGAAVSAQRPQARTHQNKKTEKMSVKTFACTCKQEITEKQNARERVHVHARACR